MSNKLTGSSMASEENSQNAMSPVAIAFRQIEGGMNRCRRWWREWR